MEFRYAYNADEVTLNLELQPDGTFHATIGGRTHVVRLQKAENGYFDLFIDERRLQAYTAEYQSAKTGLHHYIALAGRRVQLYELIKIQGKSLPQKRKGGDAGSLNAQMPGQVMSVLVKEGDRVEKGQTLLTLEAMKMELRLTAPYDGTVIRLLAAKGDTVERGQQLAEIQP